MTNENVSRLYNVKMPRKIEYPDASIIAMLKGSVQRYGDRVAYIFQDTQFTFNEVYEQSLKLANALQRMGIGRGSIVATHLPTCPQYIVAYYGIIMTGATYSPINPLLPIDDLLYQLNDCNAQAVITYDLFAQSIQKVWDKTSLEQVIVTSALEAKEEGSNVDLSSYGENWYSLGELLAAHPAEEIDVSIDPHNDLVHIAYTGGTTGRSKGVMITHYNLLCNILQSAAWSCGCLPKVQKDGTVVIERVEQDDERYLAEYATIPGTGVRISPAPLFHGAGVIGSIVFPTLMGTTTLLIERFDPTNFLESIERYHVSEVAGAPQMFNYLLRHPDIDKYDYSSVRIINSGAAPIATELMKLLIDYFPNAVVTEGYGLTEATATAVSSVSFRSGLRKLGTVGLPIYDTKVKVIALDGPDYAPLPAGEAGEVCIQGPQVMKGYYNKPEQNAETFINDWLRTGDIGVFDDEGFLSIVDRKKEMLIYNGYNVYPRKLEELLFEHPAVANAVVIGKPYASVGEIPKAFVIVKAGMNVTAEELLEFVNSKVIHYSKIRELEFVDEFPVTASGKILKRALRDLEAEKDKVKED